MMPSRNIEWWENEGGYYGNRYMEADDSSAALPGQRSNLFERTQLEIDGIIRLSDIKKKSSILDVPCGYGRHSIGLSTKGYQLVGVDLNKEHVKEAKKNAEDEGQTLTFLEGNMRKLNASLYDRFDLVINMFYSFGYFEDEEDNIQTMGEFYRAIKTEGTLFLHIGVRPELDAQGQSYFNETRKLKNGKSLLVERNYDPTSKRIIGSWTIISSDGIEDKLTPYSVRTYSSDELRKMAIKEGFNDIKFYGGFKGEDFSKQSRQMIMVARKHEL